MATLQDKIRASRTGGTGLVKGPGGTLAETSNEEIQSLTGRAGLAAPPTTAIGASLIGAGPHTQKMMGTPNQLNSAIRIAGGDTLASADRTRQTRTQATAEEKAQQAKGQDLSDLGNLPDRVNQLIESKRSALANASAGAPTAQVATPTTAVDPLANPQVVTLLRSLRSNPNDMNAISQLTQLMGRPIQPNEVASLYESAVDTIARAGGQAMSDSLVLSDIASLPEFGYSMQELGQLLGVDPNVLSNYSIPQLQAEIARVGAESFGNSQRLAEQATSRDLGSAERGLARDLGREASAVGTRATEADYSRLEEAIARADRVMFAGQEVSIEELLGNEVVSETIANYLNSPAGSPTRLQLEQTEPGLVNFIRSNETLLTEQVKALETSVGQFNQAEADKKAAAQVGHTTLDPEVSEVVNAPDSPIKQFLDTLDDSGKTIAATVLNTLSPELLEQLGDLTPEELAALQLERGESSPALARLRENEIARQNIAAISPDDVDAMIDELVGGGETADTINETLAENRAASTLLGKPLEPSPLDSDGDGELDSPEQLMSLLTDRAKPLSLRDALSSKSSMPGKVSVNSLQPDSYTEQLVLNKLGPAAVDGVITPAELEAADFTSNELIDIMNSNLADNWGAQTRVAVGNLLRNKQDKATVELLNNYYSDPRKAQYRVPPAEFLEMVEKSPTYTRNQMGQDLRNIDGIIAELSAQFDAGDPSLNNREIRAEIGELSNLRKALGGLLDEYNTISEERRVAGEQQREAERIRGNQARALEIESVEKAVQNRRVRDRVAALAEQFEFDASAVKPGSYWWKRAEESMALQDAGGSDGNGGSSGGTAGAAGAAGGEGK